MEFLLKEYILWNDKNFVTKEAVIQEIAQKAVELQISDDKEKLVESFMEREKLGSTGFGDGLAIPHAKSAYVKKVAMIIFKSDTPIEWASIDDSPVHVAIALLVPEVNTDNIHLKILSGISRKLINQTFKTNLFNAKTADELLLLFESAIV